MKNKFLDAAGVQEMKTFINSKVDNVKSITSAELNNINARVEDLENQPIDSEPISGSSNLITSDGVYTAVSNKYTKPQNGIPASDLADGVIPITLPASDVRDWAKADSKPEYSYSEILNTPVFGSAAFKDIPNEGNANSEQVVLGSDSRLSDARTPVAHNHTISEISDFPSSLPASDVSEWAKASEKPSYTASEVGALSEDTFIPTEQTISDWGFVKTVDLPSEEDPSFITSPAFGISSQNIENWNKTVSYEAQELTSAQKAQVRSNIGASNFSGDYNDLTNKPTERTLYAFNPNWRTYTTIEEFCEDVFNDNDAIVGKSYLGALECTGLPSGVGVGDTIVEIIGLDINKVVHLEVTSVEVAPYHWEASYWNGHFYGWRSFVMDGTLATVAKTGSYVDLSNKPTIPTKVSELENDLGFTSESGIGSESDPVFMASPAANITAEDIANWNSKTDNIGTLTEEVDPVFSASVAAGITSNDINNWNSKTNNIGTVTSINVGNTAYNPDSGVVTIPSYPTSLPASDVAEWAKAANKPSYTANEVGALPSDTVIPTVPEISNNISEDKTNTNKITSSKAVYDEIHPEILTEQPTDGMLPNRMYNLGTLTGSVEIKLKEVQDNIENEYRFQFTTGDTAPTIQWSNLIVAWYGNDPSIKPNKTYQVSVVNGLGIIGEFDYV